MIAEKPKAARRIAYALGDGNTVKCSYMGVPYFVVGEDVVVLPSAGHLFGLTTDERGYPVFSYRWVPIYEAERGAGFLAKYYRLMEKMLPQASIYVNACDYDIEGSVIGYLIIAKLGDPSRAYRMKYSALTKQDILRAWRRLEPLDVEMVEAGLARHEVDWIWGINISRALMDFARRASGRRIILSAGRVQSPTLVYAYKTWLARALYLPDPLFEVSVKLEKDGIVFTARPASQPKTRTEAERLARETRRAGHLVVEDVEVRIKRVKPPPAFNLPALQSEAARIYGFSPGYTQKLAEELYLAATISYPRTNSEKLPPTIGYKSILEEIAEKHPGYSALAMELLEKEKLAPRQGRKDDPAHPAIYPTGTPPPKDVGRDALRVYDLIVRRFMAAFYEDARVETVTASLRHPLLDIRYVAGGVTVVDEGWMKAYPYSKPEGEPLPSLQPGDTPRIVSVSQRLKWSQSRVPRISKMALVRWMERVGIGTEATRARIVETLYKRGYLERGRSGDRVTAMGMTVSAMLEEMFPQLSTPELTRQLERELELVRSGDKKRDDVVKEARELVYALITGFQSRLSSGDLGSLAERAGLVEPKIKCELCNLPAEYEEPVPLCRYHGEALKRIASNISRLKTVTGLDEDRLLAKLANAGGEFVSDVARLLLRRPALRANSWSSSLASEGA